MTLSDDTKSEGYKPDFSDIDSIEKAIAMSNNGQLEPLLLLPLRFGGEDSAANIVYVPIGISKIKDSIDNIVEELLINNRVSGYKCDIKYKGKSAIPSIIKIIATAHDGTEVFAPNINIW